MQRTSRTQTELHADSRTLLYEFDMLCGTADQLTRLDRTGQRIAYNATIESFAVHCRALISFFFDHLNANARDTDVIAVDFFTVSNRWALPNGIGSFLRTAKDQASKQIAHITTDRRNLNSLGGKDANWKVSDIVQSICIVMSSFLAAAPDQNMDPDAKQGLLDLVRRYASPAIPPSAPPSSPQQAVVKQVHSTAQSTTISITGKTCP